MAHPNDDREQNYQDLLAAVQAVSHQQRKIDSLLESLRKDLGDVAEVRRRLIQDAMLLNPEFSEQDAARAVDAALAR